MKLQDIFNASRIKKENEKLNALIHEMGAGDAVVLKRKIEELSKEQEDILKNNARLRDEQKSLESEILEKKKQVLVVDEELMLEDFALYKPKFSFISSTEYKNRIDALRIEQKEMIKSGLAAQVNQKWTVNNNEAQGRKMARDMAKLVLRSFNNECDYCIDNVKFNNIERNIQRIEKSYDSLNKLASIMEIVINPKYKNSKLQELYLAYEYQQKKQEEKEEQKRIREEMREQQKLDQEIKEAREKIAKEKRHFLIALKDFAKRLEMTQDAVEKNLIQQRIKEIELQMHELSKEEKLVDYREKNAQAGYVYIISNIGAFGEDVYKIGMTRRLEPLDRIYELGDASVPFEFDLHAMIFSDDARGLEARLHQYFRKNRINKINNRKEFFRADLYEIEKVIKENYDKAVDMVKIAPAEQYRESLLIED